jgi:Spy/CpxP family protein refolding chaperone
MRRTIAAITTSFVIATSPLALAQQQGPGLEKMQQHLDLTDAQVEEIRQIKAEGGSREDIKAVLTEEQQQKMQQHRKRMQGKGKGQGQAQSEQ